MAEVISLSERHLFVGSMSFLRTAAYLAETLLETLSVVRPWILTCVLLDPLLAAQ